nr:putative reverse transcriptase domain-containing protein [Tanacetum cinerariifolium]
MLRAYHLSIRCAPFEALYGRKCRSPILWAEIRESRRKLLEFKVGDKVSLKVSPWKGVIRFGKKGKLAPRYVGPFEILKRIGPVAYRLRLPEELSSVHDTFHVSNLKKCIADANLHVPLDEIKVDKTLRFVIEPVEIMDREVKSLKRSKILILKVRWNSKRGPEFTWECEEHMKANVGYGTMGSDGYSHPVYEYVSEFSVLLTPLCCDDTHDVTPHVSSLAGCDKIHATDDFKEYETVFMNIVVPINQPQSVVSTQGTHRCIPRAHMTPTFITASPQGRRGSKVIEKEKHDDEIEKEKKDDDVEKTYEVVKEKDNDEVASGSMEFRNEKMQTPIPTQTRSPKTDLSSDKTISEELTTIVSPTTATTFKDSPDIMFTVCTCLRFQVQPKVSHMDVVKRIFRYLKVLWLQNQLFDYGYNFMHTKIHMDNESTIYVVKNPVYHSKTKHIEIRHHFIRDSYEKRLIEMVLWLQNQLFDYGYNFMHTKIHMDNESTIYVVKNPVYHSKTKHIEIRHHFIRDSYEKRLIEMVKIHTDYNVADLLTKAFDVTRF